MEPGLLIYAFAVVAGLVSGLINTLAGSGSLVALAALVAMGLPATVANGTNRVGVVIQTGVGLLTLKANHAPRPKGMWWMVLAAAVGAVGGAVLATQVDAETLEWVIVAVMWGTLFVVLAKPKSWLREESDEEKGRPTLWKVLIFVAVGAWGGFLQAGVGILLLVALVLGAGKSVLEATTVKIVTVMIFTVVTLGIFVVADQVHWELGLVMGLGQGVGGWLGARFAARSPRAPIWIRRLLIVVIAVAALELMGIRGFIGIG